MHDAAISFVSHFGVSISGFSSSLALVVVVCLDLVIFDSGVRAVRSIAHDLSKMPVQDVNR